MSFASNYNYTDRILHYIAFSAPFVQKILSELESDLFKNHLNTVKSHHEVFVTGMPRSGTTLLLELLYGTGEFKTYTYRHMPFIQAPLLWDRVSRPFQKRGIKQERAHGDGMEISFDSPEAFEEIIWISAIGNKIVKQNTISTLSASDYSHELAEVIRNSIKKVLLLSNEFSDSSQQQRYLSKNNANISRIGLISKIFPTSIIFVPFRHPLSHVSSIMKQHSRFLTEHEKNRFSKQYMKWLGHYEFGENFKPINFDSWLGNDFVSSNIDVNFWLKYWTVTYSNILKNKDKNIYLVDFDKLLRNGKSVLEKIANYAELRDKTKFIDCASLLRSPTSHSITTEKCSPKILNTAETIYAELKFVAI